MFFSQGLRPTKIRSNAVHTADPSTWRLDLHGDVLSIDDSELLAFVPFLALA